MSKPLELTVYPYVDRYVKTERGAHRRAAWDAGYTNPWLPGEGAPLD